MNHVQQQALSNATNGQSASNYPAIYAGFLAKGIAETDIAPRENIFTFHAWKALGRQVRKGEHGVKIVTWIPCQSREDGNGERSEYRRAKSTTVFHISQTDPIQ